MPSDSPEATTIWVHRNTHDSLLFIKAQLEPGMKQSIGFDYVIQRLVEEWCKTHDGPKG